MPIQAGLFPVFVPFHFFAGFDEELHFHLLKFAHAEYKLPRNNLISKSLPGLCDPKWNFHATRFLDVEEVHEDTLCGLGAQVQVHGILCRRS
jgi:hypothetical protein